MQANYDLLVKVLLIGDSGVGKTALINRYVDDTFDPSFISTIGVDFKFKMLGVENKVIKLQIWDTAGQERFKTITATFYRNADGIILVYDVNDRRSYQSIQTWLHDIKQKLQTEAADVQFLLVGNKADTGSSGGADIEREVTVAQGEQLAHKLGIDFFETSAKTGYNVDTVFTTLVERCVEAMHARNKKEKETKTGEGAVKVGSASANSGAEAARCTC